MAGPDAEKPTVAGRDAYGAPCVAAQPDVNISCCHCRLQLIMGGRVTASGEGRGCSLLRSWQESAAGLSGRSCHRERATGVCCRSWWLLMPQRKSHRCAAGHVGCSCAEKEKKRERATGNAWCTSQALVEQQTEPSFGAAVILLQVMLAVTAADEAAGCYHSR